jgi:hypothetical protein
MQITLTPQESEHYFFDALCNAFGTGYMDGYGLELQVEPTAYKAAKQELLDKSEDRPCYEDILMQVLRNGDALTVNDVECDGEYTRSVSLKEVHERVSKTPIRHLMAAINEDGDAITADVILQTVFFEEVVFG